MNKARVTLNLPASIKAAAERYAKHDGVSLSQFISTAVAEKIGAMGAAEFFEKRATGGNRERAMALLASAPDVPPPVEDDRPLR